MTKRNLRAVASALMCIGPHAAVAQAPTTAVPVQSYDSFQNWLVACDNTLACVAKGFGDTGERAELSISRDAGPGGALEVTIAAEGKFSPQSLSVDGKRLTLASEDWTSQTDESGTTLSTTSLAAARSLVTALRNGASLELYGETAVPLAGFSAAMLRVDDRQGRVGSTTALMRPGTIPASRVPGPRPIPLVAQHPVSARLKAAEDQRLISHVERSATAVFKAEDCQDRSGMSPAEAYALDNGRALVLIPCLLGAYQGSSLAFVVQRAPGGKVSRVVAEAPYAGNTEYAKPIDMFTEASFDPDTGMFFTAAKGRGLADCGFSAGWVWDGTKMVLAEMSLQQSCGGIEPGDWPTLFRSRRK